MSTPLPEVNELALRLAARVLRRDVDGEPRELWRCWKCGRIMMPAVRPRTCLFCGEHNPNLEGIVLPPPSAPSPEDELKALARDIETFADLVVARLGSTRWELERAEKQLRVQDGEIEELQSKLDEERKTNKVLALQVKGVQRHVAEDMRERAVRALRNQASSYHSVVVVQAYEEAAELVHLLSLPGSPREDDTAPETPAARAATAGEVSITSPGSMSFEAYARARQASAGARAVAALEGMTWRLPVFRCHNATCPDGEVVISTCPCPRCGKEREQFGWIVPLDYELTHLVPPPAPENLPEARAVQYICENEGCGYKGSRDVPQRPGLCLHCKCELTARS